MKDQQIKTLLLVTIIVALSISAASGLLQKPEVTAEVDKQEVNVGDRIKLDVTCKAQKDLDLSFPEEPENTGEFSFIESSPIKSGWGRSAKVGRAYVMSIYTTGTHVIPPVKIKYKSPDGQTWEFTESPQVPIEVASLLTGEDTDIRDLKALLLIGGALSGIMIILMLITVGAGAGIFLYDRFKKKAALAAAAAKSSDEIAYERLMRLKAEDLPGKGLVKEYYTTLSDIVRQYLENRFAFRAPEMTTEEFLESVRRSSELEDEHKNLLREFLSHCDMVKFAKYGPSPLEMVDAFNAAERVVDQTRVIEEEEVAQV